MSICRMPCNSIEGSVTATIGVFMHPSFLDPGRRKITQNGATTFFKKHNSSGAVLSLPLSKKHHASH
jgi:hypothetical protein